MHVVFICIQVFFRTKKYCGVLSARFSSNRFFYHHIDLLRFLFLVLIVYEHLLHANMMPYVTDPVYSPLAAQNNYVWVSS